MAARERAATWIVAAALVAGGPQGVRAGAEDFKLPGGFSVTYQMEYSYGESELGGGTNDRTTAHDKKLDPRFDPWGHLSETERLKMHKFMDEKFMDKYDELTRQYYRTIAEKSRQRGK